MSRQALGKGLGALLPASDQDMIKKVSLSQITPNPFQPRKEFEEEALLELSNSIKEHGVLQPILLRKFGTGYQIIAGERRFRAAKIAGLMEIPAVVKELDDKLMSQVALIENLQREDLNPIEEALAYQSLIDQFEMTQEAVANSVGKSRVAVTNMLRLLKLSKKVQEFVSRGTITAGHAKALLALPNDDLQSHVCDLIIAEGWNVRDTESYVKKLLEDKNEATSKKNKPKQDIFLQHLSDKISEHLGTKVNIRSGKTVSKIEIEYYDNDDLERILHSIGLEEE